MDHAGCPDEDGEVAPLAGPESLQLLATIPVGRLIFTAKAMPAVQLMNLVLADGLIVMRTAANPTIAARRVA